MWCASVVNAISGACLASSATCWSFVETSSELGVSAIFPSPSSVTVAPCLPPRAPHRMSFPASPVLSGCSDFLLPVPTRFVSSHAGTASTSRRRQKDLPGSWGTPMRTCPALRPRWDRRVRSIQHVDAAFRLERRRRLPQSDAFEAPSRGLHAPCVRFAPAVTRVHATSRFRLRTRFAGWDWLPAGFHRKVSAIVPPLHDFLLSQALPGAPPLRPCPPASPSVE